MRMAEVDDGKKALERNQTVVVVRTQGGMTTLTYGTDVERVRKVHSEQVALCTAQFAIILAAEQERRTMGQRWQGRP